MTDPAFSMEEEGTHCRARLERTASGKMVQMLTAAEKATSKDIDACTLRLVTGFVNYDSQLRAAGLKED